MDNQGISFELYVDPTTRKTFVRDVRRTTEEAANAANAAGKKLRPMGELFSSRSLLQLAAGAYALQRLARAADEPSPSFAALKKDAAELAGTIGTELQAAAGGMGSAIRPLIQWLTETDAGFRGALVGGAAFLLLMPRIGSVLRTLGLAAGPWGTALAAGFVIAGAAAQAYGAKVAAVEKGMASYRTAMLARSEAERTSEAATLRERIELLEREKAVVAGQVDLLDDVSTRHGTINARVYGELSNLNEQLSRYRGMLAVVQAIAAERARLAAAGPIPLTDENITAGEKLDQINTAIATQKMTLSEARKAAQEYLDTILKQKAEKTGTQDYLNELYFAEQKAAEGTKDADNSDLLIKKAQTKQLEQQKTVQSEIRQVQQFIAGKTDDISAANERARAAVFNRGRLEAQILDIVRQIGPAAELQYLIEQRRNLVIGGSVRAKTRALELDREIAGLEEQLAQRAEQAAQKRLQAEREIAEERKRAAQWFADQQTFALTMTYSLLELQGAKEDDIRRRRIADLQAELGLRSTGYDELIAKQQELILTEDFDNQNARQKEALRELTGLLNAQRQAGRDVWRDYIEGARAATQTASTALVQVFTKGKTAAHYWVEYLERLIAEMLAGQTFKLLMELFEFQAVRSGGTGRGSGGNILDVNDLWGSITGYGGGVRLPNLPLPSGGGTTVSTRGIERRLDALSERIESAITQPLKVTGFELQGSTIRGSLAREQAAAAQRKLG